MSNPQPIDETANPFDYCDDVLDRSQDEATFQREQQEAADAADAAERCHNDYTEEEVIDYYDDPTYEDYEPSPYDGTYSEM